MCWVAFTHSLSYGNYWIEKFYKSWCLMLMLNLERTVISQRKKHVLWDNDYVYLPPTLLIIFHPIKSQFCSASVSGEGDLPTTYLSPNSSQMGLDWLQGKPVFLVYICFRNGHVTHISPVICEGCLLRVLYKRICCMKRRSHFYPSRWDA